MAATFSSPSDVAAATRRLVDGGVAPELIATGEDARRVALSVEMLEQNDEMWVAPAAGPYTGGMVRGGLLGAVLGGGAGVVVGLVGGLVALSFTDVDAWKVLVFAVVVATAALSTAGALIGGPVVSLRHDQHRRASGLEDDGGVLVAELGPNVAVTSPDPAVVARASEILAAGPSVRAVVSTPDPGRMGNRGQGSEPTRR